MIIHFVFFQAFFTSGGMLNVLETFCIYHITAPGQESGAKDLPEGYVYPTMDELADQVILFYNTTDVSRKSWLSHQTYNF